jgi:hypothetical protein
LWSRKETRKTSPCTVKLSCFPAALQTNSRERDRVSSFFSSSFWFVWMVKEVPEREISSISPRNVASAGRPLLSSRMALTMPCTG